MSKQYFSMVKSMPKSNNKNDSMKIHTEFKEDHGMKPSNKILYVELPVFKMTLQQPSMPDIEKGRNIRSQSNSEKKPIYHNTINHKMTNKEIESKVKYIPKSDYIELEKINDKLTQELQTALLFLESYKEKVGVFFKIRTMDLKKNTLN